MTSTVGGGHRLAGVVNEQELVTVLADLISIKSVNPKFEADSSEREIAYYIREFFQRNKIPCELQEVLPGRYNVVATLKGSNPGRFLLFEAHTDTVSTKGMTIDPFRPVVTNGLMYGRGSCDTKAGLAAMLYAMKRVNDAGIQPATSILLAATVDEEYGFRGVSHLTRSGMTASGAIVSEPTDLHVIAAHKGCLRWRIITRGRAAHSSQAHLGVNAISKMAAIIQAIDGELARKYQQKKHPLVGVPTVSVGVIEGGTQVNMVPDRCVIEIDRRMIPGETAESVWNEFTEHLKELKAADPDCDAIMEEPTLEDFALETANDQRIVHTACEACRSVLGETEVGGVPYCTDASKLSRAGIPSVVLGPGSIDQAHTASEFVRIDQVAKAAEIYSQVMLTF